MGSLEDLQKKVAGVGAKTIQKLRDAGFTSISALASVDPKELAVKAGISPSVAKKIVAEARELAGEGIMTAEQFLEQRKSVQRITTGARRLDDLLGGGVETQAITEVYGQYGIGKCVAGDTPVPFIDGGNLRIENIADVYELYRRRFGEVRIDDGFAVPLSGVRVLAPAPDGGVKTTAAASLYRERVRAAVEIRTRMGRVLKITPTHKLLSVSRESGRVGWRRAATLDVGDLLAAPKILDVDGLRHLGAATLNSIDDNITEIEVEAEPRVAAKLSYAIGSLGLGVVSEEIGGNRRLIRVSRDRNLDGFGAARASLPPGASKRYVWDEIVSIEEIEYDDYVYDFVVPDGHSFIGGPLPTILHNTQLCHQLAVTVQLSPDRGGLGRGAVYIDTEGTFRPERVVQIAERFELDPKSVLKNIFVARAFTVDQQMAITEEVGERILPKYDVGLLVVDSIITHFRGEFVGRENLAARQQRLNQYLHMLLKYAMGFNVAVVVTNHVVANPEAFFGDPNRPAGGHVLGHAVTTRLYIRKGKGGHRVVKLVKSPYLPEDSVEIAITERGIEDVD